MSFRTEGYMASIAQVVVRFGVDLKDFSTKMQKATREIQAMGRQMQQSGKSLTQGLTLPILALGGASVKLAADFDESMTKIQTLVGVSADVVDGFKDSVLELSGRTAKAPAELADALFTVTSAGLRGAEALQVLEMAAKGSAVGMGETKEIARAVTAVMQAYGPEAMSAAKAMDILTATVREGNLEASELAPVLGRVVGIASQLGVSFEEVGASIATFTRLGVDSSEAVTGLSGFLNALIKPSKEGADALSTVGMSFAGLRKEVDENGLAQTMIKLLNTFDGNVEALGDVIPNVRALGAVMGTAGVQAQSYLNIQNNIANSAGILNKAFEDTSKSGAFSLKQALAQLKEVGTDIGSIVLPVVANLAKDLRDLFKRFSELSDGTKETIIKVAAFAAAIGPALYVVGAMITSIGNLTKSLRVLGAFINTNPWFALAGAVAAVVAGYVSWYKIGRSVEEAAVSKVKQVEQEKKGLNSLVNTITRLNEGNETRQTLLSELQQKYPDFLGNLSSEEATNMQLRERLKEVNKEYVKKISLSAAEEVVVDNLRKQKEWMDSILATEKQITALREQLITEDQAAKQNEINSSIEGMTTYVEAAKGAVEKLKEEGIAATKVYEDLADQMFNSSASPDNPDDGTKAVILGIERIKRAYSGLGLIAQAVAESQNKLADKQFQESIDQLAGKTDGLKDSWKEYYSELVRNQEKTVEMQSQLSGFQESVVSTFGSMQSALADMFSSMLTGARVSIRGIINVVTSLIAKLAAAAVTAALLMAVLPGGGGKIGKAIGLGKSFAETFQSFAGFRVNGGPVAAGSSYVVGENGPEIFSPTQGGTIIPNHAISGMGSIGKGKVSLEVVGNVPITFQPNGSLTAVLRQEQIKMKII